MSALAISFNGPAVRATPARRPALRLTRRGRMIFLGLPTLLAAAVLLSALVAVLFGTLASPANAATVYAPIDMADYATTVTVLQGESLWTIAAEADSSRDVRDVVGEIVALNELSTNVVQAGQRLFVPVPR